MGYPGRLWRCLRRDAVPWARDNIAWSFIASFAPLLLAYLRDRRENLDRTVLHSALWFYFIAFCAYAAIQIAKAAFNLDARQEKTILSLRGKLESYVVVGPLMPSDPKIEAEFSDDRAYQSRTASLTLVNRGRRPARMVGIAPLVPENRIIFFPRVEQSIGPDASTRFVAEVGDQWGSGHLARSG
jgi:hypothetical protein